MYQTKDSASFINWFNLLDKNKQIDELQNFLIYNQNKNVLENKSDIAGIFQGGFTTRNINDYLVEKYNQFHNTSYKFNYQNM
jgi:hypothetical protein